MLEVMRTHLYEMHEGLIEAGIKEGYLQVPMGSEELRADFIRPAFHWITEVYTVEYKSMMNIKGLLSEELWKRYEAWGDFDEHREVVLLRQARNVLRKKVTSRQRPDFFKKTKIEALLKRQAKESSG